MRRAHSLTGVLALGLFFASHVAFNTRALEGHAAYDSAVGLLRRVPMLGVLGAALILALLTHALTGAWRLGAERNRSRSRNWVVLLQGATGALALVFITAHLSTVWLEIASGRLAVVDIHPTMTARLSTLHGGVPFTALGYVLGAAVCCFHWANGLWMFLVRRLRPASGRTTAMVTLACALLGATAFVVATDTVIGVATGATVLWPMPTEPDSRDEGCRGTCGLDSAPGVPR